MNPDRGTRLTSAAALITAVRSAQTVVNFALSVWLARRLSLTQHATYLHVMTLASILPVVICAPLGKLLTYFLPRTAAKGRLCRETALALAFWGALALCAVAFVPGVIELADRDELLTENRLVAGAILGASFPYAVAEYVMLARGVPRRYATVLVGVAVLLLLGVGGSQFIAAPEHRLSAALWGTLPAFALQGGAAMVLLLRGFSDDRPDVPLSPEVPRMLVPLVAAALLAQIGMRLDAFLFPKLFPAEEHPGVKALYLRGATEIPVLGALAMTAYSLVAPEIARHHAAGEREDMLLLWRRTGRMIALITIPAVGLVEAVAHELFPLLYGDKYAASVPVFRFFALALVVRVFVPQVLLEFTGAARRNLLCAAATLVLSATLSFGFVFLLDMGWVGFAAGVTSALLAANWGVAGELARRRLSATWSELAEWGAIARLAAAALAGFLAARALVVWGGIDSWPAAGRMFALCAVYVLAFAPAAWALRAVRRDDLRTLARIVTRRR